MKRKSETVRKYYTRLAELYPNSRFTGIDLSPAAIGTFLYAISTMHCMTVSLAQGGAGNGRSGVRPRRRNLPQDRLSFRDAYGMIELFRIVADIHP
jgi:hypothetical protein